MIEILATLMLAYPIIWLLAEVDLWLLREDEL